MPRHTHGVLKPRITKRYGDRRISGRADTRIRIRRQWFNSYAHLKQQSKNFQTSRNRHHRYGCLNGKTPNEFTQSDGFEPMTLGPNTKLPDLDEIPDGYIILIRFIRSDRMLDIFGEKFKVSKDLVYSYVKAVIVTEIHQLQLYLDNELAETFDYQLTTWSLYYFLLLTKAVLTSRRKIRLKYFFNLLRNRCLGTFLH